MSGRYAVFVDAGYFTAAGQWATSGTYRGRGLYEVDIPAAVSVLVAAAAKQMPGKELLRVYWYDAAPGRLPTSEHRAVTDLDDVTLRLGNLTSRGVQKGVDALIILDMYDAALAGAVSDCILLAGDGDLVEGVTRSQARGVRTLLWSFDTEQSTTSPELRRAADRHRFFDPKLLAGTFQPVDECGAGVVEPGRGELPGAESPRPSSTGRVRPSIATFPAAERMLDQARTAAAAFAHRMAAKASDSQVAAVLAGRRIPPSNDQQLIRFVLDRMDVGPDTTLPTEVVAAIRDTFVIELESCFQQYRQRVG